MQINRHDLLTLNPQGLDMALENLSAPGAGAAALAELRGLIRGGGGGCPLPGIVRRGAAPMPPGVAAIGFCNPRVENGARGRAASVVNCSGIARLDTPYTVFTLPIPPRTPALRAAQAIRLIFAGRDCIGIWGSAALEIFTGMPFTHTASDLDLVLRGVPAQDIRGMLAEIDRVAGEMRLRIDVEITLRNGAGINAREYLSDARTVLAKGLRDVELMEREAVLREL